MKSSAPVGSEEPRAVLVNVDDDEIHVVLDDRRVLDVPIVVSERLRSATPTQRKNYRFIAKGIGIHWPDVDEDLSVRGLIAAARPILAPFVVGGSTTGHALGTVLQLSGMTPSSLPPPRFAAGAMSDDVRKVG